MAIAIVKTIVPRLRASDDNLAPAAKIALINQRRSLPLGSSGLASAESIDRRLTDPSGYKMLSRKNYPLVQVNDPLTLAQAKFLLAHCELRRRVATETRDLTRVSGVNESVHNVDLVDFKTNYLKALNRPEMALERVGMVRPADVPLLSDAEMRAFLAETIAVVVAGGNANRQSLTYPKFCFPITPVMHKTNGQILAEKLMWLHKRYGVIVPWFVLTAPGNNEREIQSALKEHRNFGLPADSVHTFSASNQMAVMTLKGESGEALPVPFFESERRLAVNPGGHGTVYDRLFGTFEETGELNGKSHMIYFQIDNPLVDYRPEWLALHAQRKALVTSIGVERKKEWEKVGTFAVDRASNNAVCVEYVVLPLEDAYARVKDDGMPVVCYQKEKGEYHLVTLEDFKEMLGSTDENGQKELLASLTPIVSVPSAIRKCPANENKKDTVNWIPDGHEITDHTQHGADPHNSSVNISIDEIRKKEWPILYPGVNVANHIYSLNAVREMRTQGINLPVNLSDFKMKLSELTPDLLRAIYGQDVSAGVVREEHDGRELTQFRARQMEVFSHDLLRILPAIFPNRTFSPDDCPVLEVTREDGFAPTKYEDVKEGWADQRLIRDDTPSRTILMLIDRNARVLDNAGGDVPKNAAGAVAVPVEFYGLADPTPEHGHVKKGGLELSEAYRLNLQEQIQAGQKPLEKALLIEPDFRSVYLSGTKTKIKTLWVPAGASFILDVQDEYNCPEIEIDLILQTGDDVRHTIPAGLKKGIARVVIDENGVHYYKLEEDGDGGVRQIDPKKP